jgi:hypothetical protein
MPGSAPFSQLSNVISSIESTPNTTIISMLTLTLPEETGNRKLSVVSSIIRNVSRRRSLNQPSISLAQEPLDTGLNEISEESTNMIGQRQIQINRQTSTTSQEYRRRTSVSSQSSQEPKATSDTFSGGSVRSDYSSNYNNSYSTSNLTAENIQLWHEIHKPPKSIRTCRLSLNRGTSSVTLEPSIMFQGLHRALEYEKTIYPDLRFERKPEFYLFECWIDKDKTNEIGFELEICKVLLLKMYGLKSTNLKGPENRYKEILSDIILHLGWD